MAKVDFINRIVQRYIWDPEPKNDNETPEPIWCLGERYTNTTNDGGHSVGLSDSASLISKGQDLDKETVIIPSKLSDTPNLQACDPDGGALLSLPTTDSSKGWPYKFIDDFESRFWFTYRSHFPPIKKSTNPIASSAMSLPVRLRSHLDQEGFTSDTGWGCMIRSGQCLVANALSILRMGRSWRRGQTEKDERELLALFADDPRAPFSLHRFVEHGAAACGKYPGMWFGPSATAKCIQALSENFSACGFGVSVNGDGPDVYQDVIFRIAGRNTGKFRPVLILVGIRLGINGVTAAYWSALKAIFTMKQSIGIAGGQPSASHYFVGVQGDYFFYLDPHQVRPALPWHESLDEYSHDDIDSCHTRRLRRLHIKDMDPSMLLAFLIRDEDDWINWRQSLSHVQGKSIVHIADTQQVINGVTSERESAIDDVEVLDEEQDGDSDSFVNLQTP